MRDAQIDYSDIPPLDKSFYKKATEAWPPTKQQLTIRLDADVLRWLKAPGRGYQTRINRILRAAMESQGLRRSRPIPRRGRTPNFTRRTENPHDVLYWISCTTPLKCKTDPPSLLAWPGMGSHTVIRLATQTLVCFRYGSLLHTIKPH
jgi:uncharacterized protein (DUF4415 family)